MENSDRRSFVSKLMVAPLAGLGMSVSAAKAADMAIPGFKPDLAPTQDQIWSWVKKVNTDFGPQRLTGSKNHLAYVDWLETEFKAIGFSTQRDHYTFERWEADIVKDVAASLTVSGKTSKLDVLSYFPYSGTTLQSGPITGRLVYVAVDAPGQATAAAKALVSAPPADLADCIVAIESPCPLQESGLTPPTVYGTYPPTLQQEGLHKSPEYQLASGARDVIGVLDGKCKGILFCWTDISDDGARYQYMPFGGALRKTPGLWVGRNTATKLKAAAASDAKITMELRATITPNSPTDSLIAILPGSTDEIVTIVTHTDGTNINEENGGIALLALAKYAAALPASSRRRTLAFFMATGHMCGGPLSDKATCVGPNGQPGPGADGAGVYRDHPELIAKTVAALGIEHLGAMDWIDDGETYKPAHVPTIDTWYIGSEGAGSKVPDAASAVMAKATLAAADGVAADAIRMDVVKDGKQSPETRAPLQRGIPSMGLIPLPPFLLEASPTGAIERLSPSLFHTQVTILTKLMVTIDKLTTDELHGRVAVDSALLNASSPRSGSAHASNDRGVGLTDAVLPTLAVASLLGIRMRNPQGD